MIDTLLLIIATLILVSFVFYTIVKPGKLSRTNTILVLTVGLFVIAFLIFNTGFEKVKSDISRFIHNSSPKSSDEIYSVLFKTAKDSCVTIVNIKDQVIPKIDCCIWMEIRTCRSELDAILSSKKYDISTFHLSDTTTLLESFDGRPGWWNLQLPGDSIVRAAIRFNANNQQTLFFGTDRSHVYLCDQAL